MRIVTIETQPPIGAEIEKLSVMMLLGGLALFLYGMQLTKNGLQLFAGDRLRAIVHNLTENRFMGVVVGALVTTVIQSSSATTVMLVGFASAGLITLRQAMGVILGAAVGTTVTVQIISLRLTDYALWMVVVGFLPMLFASRKRWRYLGQVVLGFGFIFFGMGLMVDATYPIRDAPAMVAILDFVSDKPLWGVVAAAVLTAIVQSSAATLGLVLSLALAGTMTLEAAIPMVLGANIGTTATALISSVGSGVDGRRVAWAHFAFKVGGALLVLPLIGPFADLVTGFTGLLEHVISAGETTTARQIAWAHTIFNVGMAGIFLPLLGVGAKAMERLIPARADGEGAFRPKYLDERALDTPSLALGNATREMLRMAHIVQEMLDDSLEVFAQEVKVFRDTSVGMVDEISAKDDLVDLLDQKIKLYLTRLTRQELSQDQSHMEMQIITLTNNLEHIGDVIDKNLMQLARKRSRNALVFSEEGWNEIRSFHAKVSENFQLAVAAYTNRDVDLAYKVVQHKKRLGQIEDELKERHIQRLHEGLKESLETSSLHLDILSNLHRINSYVTGFAYAVLEHADQQDRDTAGA